MENSSSTSSISNITIEQLLDYLGFDIWLTLTASLILPIVSIAGVFLNALSFWIFIQKRFEDSVFFYYRLLCIVCILHLIHNIPYGILFSPRYFPQINTFLSTMFQIYYNVVTNFLYHYENTLQMGIVLTRMKILSPFVKKHFSASSRIVCLSFFSACLLIDLPVAFTFKISSFGHYFYTNMHGEQKNATLFYFESSEFSTSLFGLLLLGFSGFFLNLFLTLVVGVTLNIIFYIQYKSYLKKKKLKFEEYKMKSIEIIHPSVNNMSNETLGTKESKLPPLIKITQKEEDERKAETNMFRMIITQCSISIITRVLFMFAYVYFSFFYSFTKSLFLLISNDLVVAIEMNMSIFVFYSFNKMFREEFNKKFKKQ